MRVSQLVRAGRLVQAKRSTEVASAPPGRYRPCARTSLFTLGTRRPHRRFPTGTWLEVKGLALPGQRIEIDMEARIQR
ncbi:MAG: hypothetical protein IPJ77_10560 [Planctomycetes bacterium]|nr:hypothetical protein [Planctomycetota bacterium]